MGGYQVLNTAILWGDQFSTKFFFLDSGGQGEVRQGSRRSASGVHLGGANFSVPVWFLVPVLESRTFLGSFLGS